VLAVSLILILLGVMLVHASVSGKDFGSLLRGSGKLDASKEPTLKLA